MTESRATLKNEAEAWELARRRADLGEKQFLMRGLTAVIMLVSEQGHEVNGEVDLLLFAKALERLCEQKQDLIRAFHGEDLRWWDGDD